MIQRKPHRGMNCNGTGILYQSGAGQEPTALGWNPICKCPFNGKSITAFAFVATDRVVVNCSAGLIYRRAVAGWMSMLAEQKNVLFLIQTG